ncbi:MAG: hypothetical protein J5927_04585 [Oscillospiraceae bacterium]|nr:hypothetical protein [Oscillospiraceae bacterium]
MENKFGRLQQLSDDRLETVSGGKESDVVTSFHCPICGKVIQLKRPTVLMQARRRHMQEVHK